MQPNDWKALVRQIRKGRCTPFLGAGINEPYLPLGRDLAKALAQKYNYPFDDTGDLIRVSQYIATTTHDPQRPKEEVLELLEARLRQADAQKLSLNTAVYAPNSPIGILCELPFSVYITTNYDPLVCNGLRIRNRACKREYCRWNQSLKDPSKPFPEATTEAPILFHLHGMDEEQKSLVLTEDDYVSFLVNLRDGIIPGRISESFVHTSMLFIGYSLQDWNFRVLHQALARTREVAAQHGSFSVQLPWEDDPARKQLARDFLEQYFGARLINVFWGTASEFLAELMAWWNKE